MRMQTEFEPVTSLPAQELEDVDEILVRARCGPRDAVLGPEAGRNAHLQLTQAGKPRVAYPTVRHHLFHVLNDNSCYEVV